MVVGQISGQKVKPKNNYKLVLMEDVKRRSKFVWVGVCFVKMEDNAFMVEGDKFFEHLEWVDKDIYKIKIK